MAAFREQLSDALMKFGTEAAFDRTSMERSLRADAGRRGHAEALAALVPARWIDTAVLWMAWRLRPRHIPV